jgi:hypothetical protein
MRTLLIVVFVLCVGTCAFAQTHADENPDCFIRLDRETRAGDSITVFTDDSTAVCGSRSIILFTSSILCIRAVEDSGYSSSLTIPFDRISKITYRKPSGARFGLVLFGFVAGALAGGYVGAALAPEPEGWLDFSELHAAMAGSMIGGLVGAMGGYQVSKHLTVQVTLVCGH